MNKNINKLYNAVLKSARADAAEAERLSKLASYYADRANECENNGEACLFHATAERYKREAKVCADRAEHQFGTLKLVDEKLGR